MRCLIVAVCVGFSWPASSSSLHLSGTLSYTYSESTATIAAERVENLDASGTSGSLRLELWAYPIAYTGPFQVGYKMAQYQLNPLPAGSHYANVTSGSIPFERPPAGTWFFQLELTEYSAAAGGDGYSVVDRHDFSTTESFGVIPVVDTVVEYHHSLFDHYFITPVPAEIALLDAHQPPFEYWSRTGFSFNAWVLNAPAGSTLICRLFNDHFAPKSSHFYAPLRTGCEATLTLFPDWILEYDQIFSTMLPDADGNCPTGTIPVYRMYNQGMGGAPNHRFVTSLAERQKMIDQGFVAEGAGIGVGMCVVGP